MSSILVNALFWGILALWIRESAEQPHFEPNVDELFANQYIVPSHYKLQAPNHCQNKSNDIIEITSLPWCTPANSTHILLSNVTIRISAPYENSMFVIMNFDTSVNLTLTIVNSTILCLVSECNLISSRSYSYLTMDWVNYLKTSYSTNHVIDFLNFFLFVNGEVFINRSTFLNLQKYMFLASSVGAVTIANSLFSNSEIKPYFMYTSHTSTLLENVTFTNAIVWNTYISGFLNPKIQLVNVTFYNNTINEFYRHASGLVFCFMCGSIEVK